MSPRENWCGTVSERINRGYVRVKGCWFWLGSQHRGYGKIYVRGRHREAHRVSYELAKGKIPKGMVLDHLCRNPACINPDHLEPVTIAENIRRGSHHHREQTHCKRGHEFTTENTLIIKASGGRACRECARSRIRNWYYNRKQENSNAS